MDKDFATGPDRAGIRWLLLLATNELRAVPDHFGLQILIHVINKINASEFSAHVSLLLSATHFIPLEKGAAKVTPIVTGDDWSNLRRTFYRPVSLFDT